MPIQLHIATINTCNAACHFCVYPKPENTLPKGVMSMDLYRKIIDEAAGIPEIDSIAFSALGEPLLDRFMVDRIKYAKQAKPWDMIELYTNGVALNSAKFDALRDAGLTHLSISLNAVRPEQHEKIMGLKGKFGQVVANAKYACENGQDKTTVLIKAVRNDDQFDEQDQVIFYLTWGIYQHPDSRGGHGLCVQECNWAGSTRLIDGREFDPNSTCGRALGQISILWDGKVTMCCFDPLNTFPLGDLKTQSIKEIYNSGKYVTFREDHYNNQAAKYELCAGCTRV